MTSAEISDTDLTTFIGYADSEIDTFAGRSFADATSVTEYPDGEPKNLFGNNDITFQLKKYPIESITQFLLLNEDGTTASTLGTLSAANILAGTYTTTDYWLKPGIGEIILKTKVIPSGIYSTKIVYTYGYASVPTLVAELSASLAAIRAVVAVAGGKYDSLTSYTIPEQNVSKAEFDKLMITAKTLQEKVTHLWLRVGEAHKTMFIATAGTKQGFLTSTQW
jgi:hypothetical protein